MTDAKPPLKSGSISANVSISYTFAKRAAKSNVLTRKYHKHKENGKWMSDMFNMSEITLNKAPPWLSLMCGGLSWLGCGSILPLCLRASGPSSRAEPQESLAVVWRAPCFPPAAAVAWASQPASLPGLPTHRLECQPTVLYWDLGLAVMVIGLRWAVDGAFCLAAPWGQVEGVKETGVFMFHLLPLTPPSPHGQMPITLIFGSQRSQRRGVSQRKTMGGMGWRERKENMKRWHENWSKKLLNKKSIEESCRVWLEIKASLPFIGLCIRFPPLTYSQPRARNTLPGNPFFTTLSGQFEKSLHGHQSLLENDMNITPWSWMKHYAGLTTEAESSRSAQQVERLWVIRVWGF